MAQVVAGSNLAGVLDPNFSKILPDWVMCGSIPRPADDEKVAGCAGPLTTTQYPGEILGGNHFFTRPEPDKPALGF